MDAQEQRRLLELAAKAIGWTIFDWYGDRHTAHDGEKLVPFNPIADDGDAAWPGTRQRSRRPGSPLRRPARWNLHGRR